MTEQFGTAKTNATNNIAVEAAPTRRVPRVGNNAKNHSSDIFKFGGNLGFTNDSERYTKADIAEEEKARLQRQKESKQQRMQMKRNWISNIEEARWKKMEDDYYREKEQWERKHASTKIGKNSVSYNPITLEYHKNEAGKKLAQEDSKALYRTAMRAAHLYLKSNTFDPLRCQDIPRRLIESIPTTPESVTEPAASTANNKSTDLTNNSRRRDNLNTTALAAESSGAAIGSVPKTLAVFAARRAAVVKNALKKDDADVVLAVGAGGAALLGGGEKEPKVVKAGRRASAADTVQNEVAAPEVDSHGEGRIIVEMEGPSGALHNWARRF